MSTSQSIVQARVPPAPCGKLHLFPCSQATADNIPTQNIRAANVSQIFDIDYHDQPIRGTNIASIELAETDSGVRHEAPRPLYSVRFVDERSERP
jgi:hypothetical protein